MKCYISLGKRYHGFKSLLMMGCTFENCFMHVAYRKALVGYLGVVSCVAGSNVFDYHFVFGRDQFGGIEWNVYGHNSAG